MSFLRNLGLLLTVVCFAATQISDAATRNPDFATSGLSMPRPSEIGADRGTSCYVLSKQAYGVASYLVRDIGQASMPKIGAVNAATIRRIQRYVHQPTLRFAYNGSELIVFDAPQGPCSSESRVLNGYCNEGYDPADYVNGVVAFSGGCRNMPRPWLPHDRREGPIPWRTYFGLP